MTIVTQKCIRKPLYVDAVRITGDNFDEIVVWCQGEVQQDEVPGKGTGKKYIKVRVHNPKNPRQTKAFVGDWLLYTERGYKVYTNKAFNASFDEALPPTQLPIDDSPQHAAAVQEIKDREGVVTPPVPIENVTTTVGETTSPVPEHHNPEIYATESPEYPAETTIGGTPRDEINVGESPEMTQARETIEAEGGSIEEATPQAIAEVVDEQRIAAEAEGKRVLTLEEQEQMSQDEIRDLLTTGEAILVQDLAA